MRTQGKGASHSQFMSLIHSRNYFFSALFVPVLVADHGVENNVLGLRPREALKAGVGDRH